MAYNPRSKRNNQKDNPPTELITQFLQNQAEELKIQAQEIELRKLNEKNGFDYSCKALEVQKEDRKEQREQITTFMKYGFRLTIFILVLGALFVGACIYTDNINLIVSVLKVVAYIVPSALGGYFLGFNRGKKSSVNSGPASYAEVVED